MKAALFVIILFFITGYLHAQGGIHALYFDGVNDIVDCGSDSTLDLQDALTLEAWIRGDASTRSYARILDKYNFHSQEGYNLVRVSASGNVMLDFFATDRSKHTHGSSTMVFDNNWHYVAATFDGNFVTIFVDGRIEKRALLTEKKAIRLCSYSFTIGNGFDGATWFPYMGLIDEARAWDTALDSVIIREWMHRAITADHPDYNHLAGYWKCDEGEGSHVTDMSGKGNNGTLTNMDTSQAWRDSSVPLATELTNHLHELTAIWAGKDSSESSIIKLKGVDMGADACALFGHDNGGLDWTDFDVPTGLSVLFRLNRIWKTESYDTCIVDMVVDVADLGITEGNQLKILFSENEQFANSDTLDGQYYLQDSLFIVSKHALRHKYYYTLGTIEKLTPIDPIEQKQIAEEYHLYPNYPNPFNPRTTIRYSIPKVSDIEISVLNTAGQKIKTLINKSHTPGSYQVTWDGSEYASGVYIYQIKADNIVQSKKMLLLK